MPGNSDNNTHCCLRSQRRCVPHPVRGLRNLRTGRGGRRGLFSHVYTVMSPPTACVLVIPRPGRRILRGRSYVWVEGSSPPSDHIFTEATMSTETAGEAAPAEDTRPRPAWISLAEATRITGLHNTSVLRLALARTIGVRAVPGTRTTYSRADCERMAAADRPAD